MLLSLCLLPCIGLAQEHTPRAGAATTSGPEVLPPSPVQLRAPEVRWQPEWQRVRPWQYALLGALALENAYRAFVGYGVDHDARFGGPWPPLDRPVHDALFVHDAGARQDLQTVSDLVWHATLFFPVYADALGAALIGHGEPDVAWQLTAISGQAILMIGLVNWATRTLVRRERPVAYEARRTGVDQQTHEASGGSFFSGHAAMAFTGAGLTCAFHERLPLFGGGVADDAACYTLLAVAGAVSASRFLGGSHYASDVLVGATVGVSIGLGLPLLLHFGRHVAVPANVWLVPEPGPEGLPGARLVGVF